MQRQQVCEHLQELAQQNKAEVSVLWYPIGESSPAFTYRADCPMVSASVIKVPIMLAALQQVQQEKATLNTSLWVDVDEILEDTTVYPTGPRFATLEELITWMIILSDNTSTNALIEWLGMETINSFSTALGLENTVLQRKMLDFEAIKQGRNNYTSAQDMQSLFAGLAKKEILTPALCAKAWNILAKQRDTKLLPRYIWEDAVFVHKTGGLDYLSHDAGVITVCGQSYYLGVFVQNAGCLSGDEDFIGHISRIIFDYYSA